VSQLGTTHCQGPVLTMLPPLLCRFLGRDFELSAASPLSWQSLSVTRRNYVRWKLWKLRKLWKLWNDARSVARCNLSGSHRASQLQTPRSRLGTACPLPTLYMQPFQAPLVGCLGDVRATLISLTRRSQKQPIPISKVSRGHVDTRVETLLRNTAIRAVLPRNAMNTYSGKA